ncbi:outer membrane protein assembly factor BamB family protein [Saccharibacillus kuerlensis]|uniref:Pyrrolo-quinoline quinone repeat domain-containing protein n=1 Tax=Saccharibacillus kuerlensis TaxID=459527 RepID=A0ABQ2KRK2_9BACL|nr:PQQ-binding-like beta-propeller repeat protein [Saccharibacillus kuerlensis]GGN90996.1 hypothetical protein GCM10010969_02030 [Saccharibacillus kuerlensis]
MKYTSIEKPRTAALKHKRELRRSKRERYAVVRIGAALCLPLILLPAAATPAYSAALIPQQESPALTDLKTTMSQLPVPYFKKIPVENNSASLGVSYYEKAGVPLNVTGRTGELLEVRTPFGEKAYVPGWYTEAQAAETKKSNPVIVQLRPDARLHLFPDSELSWPAAYAPVGALSAIRYGDWYGISLQTEPGYENGSVVRPALLWVQAAKVQSTQQQPSGLLSADSTVPTDMVRSLTETTLHTGTAEERVLQLLGEPYSRTPLPHFETSSAEGEEKERGELWRYERSDAQLTISFDAAGRLSGWNWILPTAEAAQVGVNSSQPPYTFQYDFRTLPPALSVSPKPLWQSQSSLDAQYLLAAADDVLLVQEDNAYIGSNQPKSSIYALDRSNGERLWSLDTGYGALGVLIGINKNSALVLTGTASQEGHPPMLRSVRLSDGALRWSRKAGEAEQALSLRMAAAGTSLLLSTQPSENEKGILTAMSQRSGIVRWSKEFTDPYTVLNQGSDDPYVLIQQGRWIQALDHRTGQAAWSLKADEYTQPSPYLTSDYLASERADLFVKNDGTRWVTLGGDWVRLNTSSGEILGRYPKRFNEQIDALGGDYLLIRRAVNASNYESGSLFETILYNAKEDRELWTIPGRAERTLLGEDRLYVLMNGIPAALSLENGQPIWTTETSEFALSELRGPVQAGSFMQIGDYLLLPYGPDLLSFDKGTGELLRRIDGFSVTYNENNGRLIRNGILNNDGQTIYVGSANGQFTAYNAKEIEKALDDIMQIPASE